MVKEEGDNLKEESGESCCYVRSCSCVVQCWRWGVAAARLLSIGSG